MKRIVVAILCFAVGFSAARIFFPKIIIERSGAVISGYDETFPRYRVYQCSIHGKHAMTTVIMSEDEAWKLLVDHYPFFPGDVVQPWYEDAVLTAGLREKLLPDDLFPPKSKPVNSIIEEHLWIVENGAAK